MYRFIVLLAVAFCLVATLYASSLQYDELIELRQDKRELERIAVEQDIVLENLRGELEAERNKPPTVIIIYERVEVEVPRHNEPTLQEFESLKELRDYVRWWRNEKMVQYGKDQCEDYAYDFFQQGIADGYVISTELVFKGDPMFGEVCHMANLVPVGNRVYLVDISSGNIELYALKD